MGGACHGAGYEPNAEPQSWGWKARSLGYQRVGHRQGLVEVKADSTARIANDKLKHLCFYTSGAGGGHELIHTSELYPGKRMVSMVG